MDRGVQVEEGRVGHRLPARLRSRQADAALPEFAPDIPVAPPQFVEAKIPGDGDETDGLPMRLAVQDVGHEADEDPEPQASTLRRPLGPGGGERTQGVPGLLGPLGLMEGLGEKGQAEAAQRALGLPEQGAVADWLCQARRIEAALRRGRLLRNRGRTSRTR